MLLLLNAFKQNRLFSNYSTTYLHSKMLSYSKKKIPSYSKAKKTGSRKRTSKNYKKHIYEIKRNKIYIKKKQKLFKDKNLILKANSLKKIKPNNLNQSSNLKLKKKKFFKYMNIFLLLGFHNYFAMIITNKGHTVFQVSSGCLGFKKKDRGSPYAYTSVLNSLFQFYNQFYRYRVRIRVKGYGRKKLKTLKHVLKKYNIRALGYKNETPIPHNGCRLKKQRR